MFQLWQSKTVFTISKKYIKIGVFGVLCLLINQTTANESSIFQSQSGLQDNTQTKTVALPDDTLPVHHVALNAISPNTIKTFVQVVDLVRRHYAGDTNDDSLFRYAMSGMLTRLDNHAEFLDETAFRNLQAFSEGSVAGVGLSVSFDQSNNAWVVVAVENLSSAQKAEIAVGDFLHKIGDKQLNDQFNDKDVTQMLAGLAGSQIDVTISKQGRNQKTLNLQRTTLINDKLSVVMNDGIAIVTLPVFTENTRQELNERLALISTPIQAMIIDVRNNPGGVLSSAINVASLFISNKPVVQITQPQKPIETLSTAATSAPLANLPIMLLQNRYSASASEVLALALKKDSNAIIAGETSYGKGSIQSVITVGNNEAIKITTAYYKGTDGTKIDGVGVLPDVVFDGIDDSHRKKNNTNDYTNHVNINNSNVNSSNANGSSMPINDNDSNIQVNPIIQASPINLKKDQWLSYALELMNDKKLDTGIIVSLSDDY